MFELRSLFIIFSKIKNDPIYIIAKIYTFMRNSYIFAAK